LITKGAGAYGAVHKAVWRDCDVAVKLLANAQNLTRVYQQFFFLVLRILILDVVVLNLGIEEQFHFRSQSDDYSSVCLCCFSFLFGFLSYCESPM
jgi:hypothetical protein